MGEITIFDKKRGRFDYFVVWNRIHEIIFRTDKLSYTLPNQDNHHFTYYLN